METLTHASSRCRTPATSFRHHLAFHLDSSYRPSSDRTRARRRALRRLLASEAASAAGADTSSERAKPSRRDLDDAVAVLSGDALDLVVKMLRDQLEVLLADTPFTWKLYARGVDADTSARTLYERFCEKHSLTVSGGTGWCTESGGGGARPGGELEFFFFFFFLTLFTSLARAARRLRGRATATGSFAGTRGSTCHSFWPSASRQCGPWPSGPGMSQTRRPRRAQ